MPQYLIEKTAARLPNQAERRTESEATVDAAKAGLVDQVREGGRGLPLLNEDDGATRSRFREIATADDVQ